VQTRQPSLDQRINNCADQPADCDDDENAGRDLRNRLDLSACDEGFGNVPMKIGGRESQSGARQREQERRAKPLQPTGVPAGSDLRPDVRSPSSGLPGVRPSMGKVSYRPQGGCT
jgi:hypothetical protein